MFTVAALALTMFVAWAVGRFNDKDRATYNPLNDDAVTRALLLHIRQDVKLIAFFLGVIAIMLGVVADRSH